ncbi:hypothetical protein [Lacrimispora sp. JR3]|uniref:hypothetical protein n=1 Tax=Lacrimispora sinapis TaxID=3111456 RepID=UPI0037484FB4
MTVTLPGVYLADAHVQVAPGNSGVIGLQVNDDGVAAPYLNAGSVNSVVFDVSGVITINTVLTLDAGDTVSLVNVTAPQFTTELLNATNDTGGVATLTPTGTIRLIRLNET